MPGKFSVPLPPVCSKSIFDAKSKKELQIIDVSVEESSAAGGQKVILLCEKIARDDIRVRYSETFLYMERFAIF